MTRTRAMILGAFVAFLVSACSDSDACQEIDAICHDADDHSGDLATDCHEIGHVGDIRECRSRLDECLTFCTEKIEQGGGGHDHGDAGHGSG